MDEIVHIGGLHFSELETIGGNRSFAWTRGASFPLSQPWVLGGLSLPIKSRWRTPLNTPVGIQGSVQVLGLG